MRSACTISMCMVQGSFVETDIFGTTNPSTSRSINTKPQALSINHRYMVVQLIKELLPVCRLYNFLEGLRFRI
ncbi:hypothetical protein V3C99_006503 [Haemonchus contortus]